MFAMTDDPRLRHMSRSNITPRVVAWAAQECSWQQSGELSVAWMTDAWRHAHRRHSRPIEQRDVLAIGRIVEPRHNMDGLRQVGVRVGSDVKLDWRLVPDALERLIAAQPDLATITEDEATEWFRQYEEIHPFRDGNGRSGSIFYNWLRGSLNNPIHPPNLWNDWRRSISSYPEPDAGPFANPEPAAQTWMNEWIKKADQ